MTQILKSPDVNAVKINVEAMCHRCKHRHKIDVPPDLFGRAAFDWEFKHRACEQAYPGSIEFLSPKRFLPRGFDDRVYEKANEAPWWLEYKHNADIKIAYANDAQVTITLASLATSSTWVAGRESASVDNGTNKYLDYEVTGKITTGTPPAGGEIRLYAIKPINDTPTWPDVFDGTDSNETVTNTAILDSLPLIWSGTNSTANDITYPIISAMTLAQLWGYVPSLFGFFVSQSTTVNLNATGGNHELSVRGAYATST